jgi:hypothetical protein
LNWGIPLFFSRGRNNSWNWMADANLRKVQFHCDFTPRCHHFPVVNQILESPLSRFIFSFPKIYFFYVIVRPNREDFYLRVSLYSIFAASLLVQVPLFCQQ